MDIIGCDAEVLGYVFDWFAAINVLEDRGGADSRDGGPTPAKSGSAADR